MSAKKWPILFVGALLLSLCVWAGVNVAVDPFGVFGGGLLPWPSYEMTNNPKVAKLAWLGEHPGDYDSYVIGSSSAAFYDTELLNRYYGAKFFNTFSYGSNMQYCALLAQYLVENGEVKNILLNVGINEANTYEAIPDTHNDRAHRNVSGDSTLHFFGSYAFSNVNYALEKWNSYQSDTELPQVFDVFDPASGCYDKRVRDVEPIGSLSDYMSAHDGDFGVERPQEDALAHIADCVEAVNAIKKLCEAHGVNLTVVFSPVYEGQLAAYSREMLSAYMEALASVTDYWNFAVSSISYDPRYFYDVTHARNATGAMALAKIFGDNDVYAPEDFGVHIKSVGDAAEYCATMPMSAGEATAPAHTQNVPILMYHHLDPASGDGMTITVEGFRRQMEALKAGGYTPVSLQQMMNYVYQGGYLPERAVCITFDDGYNSNYEYAYPILQEYGFPAAIFVIGVSVGREQYKDTEYAMQPHFGAKDIREMTASGLITVSSHTYDLHQWAPFEQGDAVRPSLMQLPGESERDYIAALTEDFVRAQAVLSEAGLGPVTTLAFPMGWTNSLADMTLRSLGVKLTLTTEAGRVNTLIRGLPQSLVNLGRKTMDDTISDRALLDYLDAMLAA